MWEQILNFPTSAQKRRKKITEKKAKLKEGRFSSGEVSGYNRIVDKCVALCMCSRKQDS